MAATTIVAPSTVGTSRSLRPPAGRTVLVPSRPTGEGCRGARTAGHDVLGPEATVRRVALGSDRDQFARLRRLDGFRVLGELQPAKHVQPPELAIACRPEQIARFRGTGHHPRV